MVKKYWEILGPELTTGVADNNPSGIATYSQIGAQYGFGLIAPIILFLIMRISSSEEIMGKFKNKKLSNIFGWLTTIVMFIVALLAIFFILV